MEEAEGFLLGDWRNPGVPSPRSMTAAAFTAALRAGSPSCQGVGHDDTCVMRRTWGWQNDDGCLDTP